MFIPPSPQGLTYLPYQREGIALALKWDSVLFGDEMGLGKTIQSIGWMNCHTELESVLVVCPATLKINWAREINKWLISPCVDVTITNYDVLHKLDLNQRWDLAVLDEGQYIKSEEAQRTQLAMKIKSDYRHLLSGIPMPNRPIELWPLLRWLHPEKFSDKMRKQYAAMYCNGHVAEIQIKRRNGSTITKSVWDESGASNLDQLREHLYKHIMIRRLKADVLKDLPPKRRQLIELPSNGIDGGLFSRIMKACDYLESIEDHYYDDVQKLDSNLQAAWEQMAELRHEAGLKTLPMALEIIHDTMASVDKLVVWAYHRDVIESLNNALVDYRPVMLHGGTSPKARQIAIDSFQNDPRVRIFIGQIQAAGPGVTLTAASQEVFVEEDWTPGAMDNAEDRCHRIGQHDSVLIRHLVLENSLDIRMAKSRERKRRIVERALNKPKPIF